MECLEEVERLRGELASIKARLDALAARLDSSLEQGLKEALLKVMEEAGYVVERWEGFDEEGYVYGYPCSVEAYVASDELEAVLVEATHYLKPGDVAALARLKELYERFTGSRLARIVVIAPYAHPKAVEACLKMGVELYSRV